MDDLEFLRVFESCELPKELFHHRQHIRLAWICLRFQTQAEAEDRVVSAIRRYAAHLEASEKYHQTITLAWMRLVALAVNRASTGASFEQLLEAFPYLLDKDSLGKFYSPALLQSAEAREHWVDPDLKPLE
jgi:hypothetical protein